MIGHRNLWATVALLGMITPAYAAPAVTAANDAAPVAPTAASDTNAPLGATLDSASALAKQSEILRDQVNGFLSNIRVS